jgi:hypothetical protein
MSKILLDIDGVILPTREEDPWGHFSVCDWQGEKRMIAEEMRSRVVRLFQLGEVIWCSAWRDKSSLLARSLVVPEKTFLPFDIEKSRWSQGMSMEEISWKLHAISTWDDGKTPLIWIDDNIEEDSFLWQRERTAPTLLIKTEESIGLEDSHVEEVVHFMERLSE